MTERWFPHVTAALAAADSGSAGCYSNGVAVGSGGMPKCGTTAFGRTIRPAAGD